MHNNVFETTTEQGFEFEANTYQDFRPTYAYERANMHETNHRAMTTTIIKQQQRLATPPGTSVPNNGILSTTNKLGNVKV